MAYVESHQQLAKHPKTIKAARQLGISLPTMVGHLHYLWWWALDYAQDGDVTDFDAADLAGASLWDADAEGFVTALLDCGYGGKAGFLERAGARLLIHDWWDYGGKYIDKKDRNAARMREARALHVQHTYPPREEKRREEKKNTTPDGVVAADTEASPRDEPSGGRPRDELWDALSQALDDAPGLALTRGERGRRNKALVSLRGVEARPQDILERAASYRERWPGMDLTATALEANWATLAKPRPKERDNGHAELLGSPHDAKRRVEERRERDREAARTILADVTPPLRHRASELGGGGVS